MVKNIIVAALLIGLSIGISTLFQSHFKSQKGSFFVLENGQKIPDFSFISMDGQSYDLSDFHDRPVIIHFWATWCPPCVVELPELVAVANDTPDTVVLAFSTDRMRPVIERFFEMNMPDVPDNFIVIFDENKAITEGKFNVFRLPESYILDEQHQLNRHIIGASRKWQDIAF